MGGRGGGSMRGMHERKIWSYLFSASDIPRQMFSREKLLITYISVAEYTQCKLRRNVVIVLIYILYI